VSAAGVETLRSHVQAVLVHPEPTNIGELQAFLGTVNFYRRLVIRKIPQIVWAESGSYFFAD
jgi:hypothetical protein